MESISEPWDCFLQQEIAPRDVQFQHTFFPLQNSELSNSPKTDRLRQVERFQLGNVQELATQDDFNALINSYVQNIMTLTGQDVIVFWIIVRQKTQTNKHKIIRAEFLGNPVVLDWKLYGDPLQDGESLSDISDFCLCLDMNELETEVDLNIPVKFAMQVEFRSRSHNIFFESDLRPQDEMASILQQFKPTSMDQKESRDDIVFWTEELRDFVGSCDRQFPSLSCERWMAQSDAGILSQTLSLDVSMEEIELFVKKNSLKSAGSVIRAAFAYTLAEYLESEKVILGETIEDSSETATEPSMSVLPIPIAISPQDSSRDMVSRIDEFIAKSVSVRIISQQLVSDILQCQPAQAPHNAAFIYRTDFEPQSCALTELGNSFILPPQKHSIALAVQSWKDNSFACTLSAREDLMDLPHLEMVLQEINALVIAMVAAPDQPMRDLTKKFPVDLLSLHAPLASEQLLWAPSISPSHWVDHWAASNPTWKALEICTAINDQNIVLKTWSYLELSQTSNQVCSWLVQQGWQKKMIAVCLGRSFMAYALVLGIWKSGNCYLPLAEDLPEERRVFLLSDSDASVLLTDKETSSNLVPPSHCRIIDITSTDFLEELDKVEEATPLKVEATDNSYLLYTSGSTGLPKGVLVGRGNLSAFVEAQSEYICRDVPDTLKLGGSGKYLAHASRAFDVHVCEMVLAWRHGLRLLTAPRSMLLDNLPLVLRQLHVTHAGFVPSLLEQTGLTAEELPDLRYLGVGGEKISETIIERFVSKGSITLVNAYGPTEVSIGMTSHTVTAQSTIRNIGTAVGNITIFVLEPGTAELVKRGQPGELCVTGDLVANGYLNRPDATGFTDFQGQRMYRTGDIVRLMANNCIEYLGRRDNQAKIRGQRLELEEVSVALRRCADRPVQVTSLVVPSPITQRPQLVAFISPSGEGPQQSQAQPTFLEDLYQEWTPQILARCREQLPAYMVPSVLLPVSFIPIQISGKADGRRLISLYQSLSAPTILRATLGPSVTPGPNPAETSATMNADEELVHRLLCTAVSADPSMVTSMTNIMQLGIDSLNSIGFAAKMRKAGYVCAVSDILKHPTISELAALPKSRASGTKLHAQFDEVKRRLDDIDHSARQLPKAVPNSAIAIVRPCFTLQESLVASSLNDSSQSLYINHITWRLGPRTNFASLRTAFEDLITENEILRTCFHFSEDKIVQLVLKPRAADLHWRQIAVTDEQNAQSQFADIQAEIAADIVQRIQSTPPFRILAASSIDNLCPGWLMLSIHHSIFDGASMLLFLERLQHHYKGERPTHYTDLTPLYQHFSMTDNEATENFWCDYLAGCQPSLVAAENSSDPKLFEIMTQVLPFKLSTVAKLASKISTTAPSVLETVWGIALANYLKQGDIIFGRVLNGRAISVESVESMLVPLVTTVPVRLKLPAGPSSVVSLIKENYKTSLDVLQYQHTALRDIQRFIRASGPLFNSMFTYMAIGPRAMSDELLLDMDTVMPVDYPLALEIRAETEIDSITLRLRVDTSSSALKDARTLIKTMTILLQALTSSGDAMVNGQSEGSASIQQPEKLIWDEEQWEEDETKLRSLVSEITHLPHSQISKNASFFALGIDSVIAIQLARRAQKMGLSMSSGDVMKHPSIGALYNHLKNLHQKHPAHLVDQAVPTNMIKIDPYDANDTILETYPCTPLQTAMIAQCLGSEGRLYVHHHVVVVDDSIDLDQLASAWFQLVQQTDILRTSFHQHESSRGFIAAVHSYPQLCLSHQSDVSSFSEAIDGIVEKSVYPQKASFHSPPWNITFLTKQTKRLMVVTMHHCLYDGFSMPLLFDHVESIYRGEGSRVGSFAPAARRIAQIQKSSIQFWADKLQGYCNPRLLEPLPVKGQAPVQWAEAKVTVPLADLQHYCASLGITIQTVALLAFGRSLATLLGQRDVVFGHVVSGRGLDIDAPESILGPLFNTVPFRLTLDPILQSTRSTLNQIQSFSADSQSHQHASLGMVQKLWRQTTPMAGSSLFDSIFTFNKTSDTNPMAIFKPYVSDRLPDIPDYRLNVEFEQSPECLLVRISSRALMASQDQFNAWVQDLILGFDDIVSHPDAPVLSFPSETKSLPLHAPVEGHNSGNVGADTPIQAYHAGIIKESIAKVTSIPLHMIDQESNVFAMGLDSILAIDVSVICRNAGLKLSISDILQGETISGIAKLAAKKFTVSPNGINSKTSEEYHISPDTKAEALSTLRLSDETVETVLPCLSGQMYYLARWLQTGRKLWEFTFPFVCRSRIEAEPLKQAWLLLRQRHSVLRTSFAAVSPNEIVQVVWKASTVNESDGFNYQQLSGELQTEIEDKFQSIADKPSDLLAPPARLCLMQHPDSDVLLLTLHHALYDAWTIPMLLKDLEALYLGQTLPPPIDFSSFIRHTQLASNTKTQDVYWKHALTMAQSTILGSDTQSAAGKLRLTSSKVLSYPLEISKIEALFRQKGISIRAVVLLALGRSLARATDVTNPALGLFQFGRSSDYPSIEAMAGPAINVLPLVISNAVAREPLEALQSIQQGLIERNSYDQTDLKQLLQMIETDSSALHFNLFANLFWGQMKESSGEQPDTLFAPFQMNSTRNSVEDSPFKGQTAVDLFDTTWLRPNNVLLDVNYSQTEDALDWNLDYPTESLSAIAAESFLRDIGREIGVIADGLTHCLP